ncbi:MAG: ankyrin repeat domain-containing protein [Candidatus Marithrix sp.]
MDNKGSTRLRSRHREASDKDRILDVTNLDDIGNGTRIIPESSLTENHIRSQEYYIASLDRSNFDKAINVLKNPSSRIKSPVPQRSVLSQTLETAVTSLNKTTTSRVVIIENLDNIIDHIRMKIRKIKYIGPSDNICSLANFPSIEYLEDAGANNNQFIISASENGCLKIVKFLASLDDVNAGDHHNEAIIQASKNGHLDVVMYLASLDSVNSNDKNYEAIIQASKNGHLDIVKFLISRVPSLDDHLVVNFVTPAIETGQTEVVGYLINLISKINRRSNIRSFINEAVKSGKIEIVKLLLSLENFNDPNDFYDSAILASKNGYLEILKALISTTGYEDSDIFEYLNEAIKGDYLEIVEYLLSLVNFFEDDNKYARAIRKTIKYERLDILKYMDELYDTPTYIPFYFASYASSLGKLEMVKYLANLHTANSYDLQNAFIEASKAGYLDIVKYLEELPSVDIQEKAGTAFIEASKYGYLDIVKYLAELSSVDIQDSANEAFSEASRYGNLDIVKYLAGLTSVNPVDKNNKALRLAHENDHNDIIEFLLTLESVKDYMLNNGIFDIDCSKVDSDELCDVCFSENVNMKYNPCSHLICRNCIQSWRQTSETCPFCRTSVIRQQD